MQAYEMEIDDYLHWPLSGAELTGRIRGLLKSGAIENSGGLGKLEIDSYDAPTFAEMSSLVDRFSDSLSMIPQSLEDIRPEQQEGMAADLSDDLMAMAAIVQTPSGNMHQYWHLKAEEPACEYTIQSRCFH